MTNLYCARFSLALVAFFCITVNSAYCKPYTGTVISGHVFYGDDRPVADAEVEWRSFSAVGGILPAPVRTDKQGFFRIPDPIIGLGVLTASKTSEGFPNAALSLYGKYGETGYKSLKTLEVRTGVALVNQDLRFEAPDAVLHLRVIDAKTSSSLSAVVSVGLPNEQSPLLTQTVGQPDQFELVLPKHPITLRVSAPGFQDWVYRNEVTGIDNLSAPPGKSIDLVAALKTQ